MNSFVFTGLELLRGVDSFMFFDLPWGHVPGMCALDDRRRPRSLQSGGKALLITNSSPETARHAAISIMRSVHSHSGIICSFQFELLFKEE